MSLDTSDFHDEKDVSINPGSSAQFCLQKLSEFSHLKDHDENTTILSGAIDFIREVTSADYIVICRLTSNKKKCTIQASYGLKNLPAQFDGPQVDVIAEFSKRKTIFNAKEFGYRQIVSSLIGEAPIRSGVSIPITVDSQSHGCLLILSKKDEIYSQSKITFLDHITYLISHYLQQKLLFPFEEHTARKVVAAKQEWEKTIDALPQLVVVLDFDSKIVRVNQAIDHWGLGSVSSFKGNAITELLSVLSPDQDNRPLWSIMWQQLTNNSQAEWEYENEVSGMSLRFSLRRLHNSNSVLSSGLHYFQGYAVLIVDNITDLVEARKQQALYTGSLEQQLVGKVRQLEDLNRVLAQELEQHKIARQALKVSESRYTHLVENTLVGICILDEGRIEYCNNRFAQILGLELGKVPGIQLLRLVDPEYRTLVFKELNGIVSGQSPKFLGTIKIVGGDRKERWVNVKLNCLSAEEPEKILVNIVDVTTQKEIEFSLRESEKDLHNLYGRLVNSLEIERKRLASELHDSLGQMLSSMKYQVENTIKKLDRAYSLEAASFSSDLHTVVYEIRQAIDETRRMAMDLRPTILDDLGIIQTISWFCRQFQKKYDEIQIVREISVDEDDVDEKLKLVIYRIMQEAFNNIAKHSGASEVALRLYKNANALHLKIEDNGQGFSFEKSNDRPDSGLGLNNMRERAEQSGGALHIEEIEPSGICVNAIWIIEQQ